MLEENALNDHRWKLLFGLAFTSVLFILNVEYGMAQPPIFPSSVETVDGKRVDVGELVKRRTVVVITLKATWCPVCRNQLLRIGENLDDFERCNVTFLVLSPGPRDELIGVKKSTEFPYPFIEDKNLAVARSLELQMSEAEIRPSILILDKDLSIKWIQRGRNILYYGDPELLEQLDCSNWI